MRYKQGTFITVPNQEILNGIHPIAQCVFMWLCFYSNQDGECFPSIKTLAKNCGISESSVKKQLKILVNSEILIKQERRKLGKKENESNLYTVLIKEGGSQSNPGKAQRNPPVGHEVTGNQNHNNNQINPPISPLSQVSGSEKPEGDTPSVPPAPPKILKKFEDTSLPFPQFIQKTIQDNSQQEIVFQMGAKHGLDRRTVVEVFKRFVEYWTEKNPGGKKMRWEMERVFDPKLRLNTFFIKRATNFGRGAPEKKFVQVDGNRLKV